MVELTLFALEQEPRGLGAPVSWGWTCQLPFEVFTTVPEDGWDADAVTTGSSKGAMRPALPGKERAEADAAPDGLAECWRLRSHFLSSAGLGRGDDDSERAKLGATVATVFTACPVNLLEFLGEACDGRPDKNLLEASPSFLSGVGF